MNIYEVVSETMAEVVCEDWFNQACHEEPYCIAHIVAAHTPSQARYMAWKTDDDFTYDLRDMPKFSVYLCKKNIDITKPRLLTNEKKYQKYWR